MGKKPPRKSVMGNRYHERGYKHVLLISLIHEICIAIGVEMG